MAEGQYCSEDRFAASGISSIIFAPPQQNSYLYVVTTGVSLLNAVALECIASFDESAMAARTFGNWLTNASGQRNDFFNSTTEYIQQPTSSVTQTLPTHTDATEIPSIAARRFPFVTHSDLVTSPVEGTFFDPDDFNRPGGETQDARESFLRESRVHCYPQVTFLTAFRTFGYPSRSRLPENALLRFQSHFKQR